MPHLILSGQIKNKKQVVEYFHALSKELGINRMWSKVIFVKFETVLDDESQGLCWGDIKEGYVTIQIARKSDGEKIPYETMMQTLAHEMVHVKQFARNELYETSAKQGSRWRGEWFSPRQKCVKDYWDQPWEIEAHGRECGLFVRWAELHKYSKKKWAQYD